MSEEEKESFEELKKEINKPLEVPEDKCNTFILYNIDNAKVIVNLIEKQQKEIKKLLKAYKQDEKIIQEMAEFIYGNDTIFYLPKDVNTKQEVIDYFRKRCK